MKTSTMIGLVLGGLAVLGAGGAAVYFATRGKAETQDQGALADARAREAEAKAAQARADAAKAAAEAQKAAAEAADKPLAEEILTTVIDDLGDWFKGTGSSLFKL